METDEFIDYIRSESWCSRWVANPKTDKFYEEFQYERSYADFIYDELTIWKDTKTVSVFYNDIGWGYSDIISYSFTYEEFKQWWESIK